MRVRFDTTKRVEKIARSDIDDERVARRLVLPTGEFSNLRDELRRQVIDDEKAKIFEHLRGM